MGAIVLLLFGGGGKIPKLARDMGLGINAFKKGLKESKDKDKDSADGDDDDPKPIEQKASARDESPVEAKEKTGTDA